jgi:hypothetical protein
MAIAITLITAAMIALATLELWLFWTLGEREDARRRAEAGDPLPTTADPPLAPGAAASQPERPAHLEAHARPRDPMATRTPHPASLAQPTL